MGNLAIVGGVKTRVNPFPASPVIGEEERRLVNEVLDTGQLSGFIAQAGDRFLGGPKVLALEALVKQHFSVEYAVTANSATAGLHMAIAAAGIGPGDEVIVTPYTMSASAAAILMANAIPVFADIDEDIFCIDPDEIEKKITPLTKAIVVVHLFGQSADMDQIMAIAKKHRLTVIEDTAQAPDAEYKGKLLGTIGDAGILSLNQHKTITSGEGGVLITNRKDIAEKARLIRNHGEVIVRDNGPESIMNTLGWNYRMTELEAAVAIGQFKQLDFLTEHRIGLAENLSEFFKQSAYKGITPPVIREDNKHVYFLYPMKFNAQKVGVRRETFVKAILAEGVPMGQGYVEPIYMEPLYQNKSAYGNRGCPFSCSLYKGSAQYGKGLCPVTERMYEFEVILLPLCRYPIQIKDLDDVKQAFEKVFSNLDELKEYEKST